MCLFNSKSIYYQILNKIKAKHRPFSTNAQTKATKFEDIPGPLSLPIIGTLYLYLPLIGRYQFDRLHRNALKNYKLYGPIIREEIVPGQHIVWLGDPDDIAKMFQTEGVHPHRQSHLALEKYRLDRPHIYNSGGLLPTNGPEWARTRKVFQKGLSSPSEALNFIKGSNEIISEWMETRLQEIADDCEDLMPELSRLFLEIIGVAFFDVRFRSYFEEELHPASRSSKLLESAFVTNSTILKADNGPQLWRKFETPAYRRLRKAQEIMERCQRHFDLSVLTLRNLSQLDGTVFYDNPILCSRRRVIKCCRRILIAIDLVAMKMSTFKEKTQSAPTLLESYIASSSLDFKDIIGIVCDFLLAGMDTTTYSTSFLLYHLALNPQVQEKLYEEASQLLSNPNDPVTPELYKKATYAKCVVKESLRLRPISVGVGRILTSDVIFSGYKVPEGTIVVTLNQMISRLEKFFPEAEKFKPERWIRGDPSFRQTHPYLVLPFGHGQRTCIARRFAEQNMVLLTLKLARKYRFSWKGCELDSKSLLINVPDGPILLKWEKR